jgi:hypothetical protein
MKMTVEELKQDGIYRYLKFLSEVFSQAGIDGEPFELPMEAVLKASLPAYLSVAAAVRTKIFFVLSIYSGQGRMGALLDGVQGTTNMLGLIAEELDK